jgi:hypothetical protein
MDAKEVVSDFVLQNQTVIVGWGERLLLSRKPTQVGQGPTQCGPPLTRRGTLRDARGVGHLPQCTRAYAEYCSDPGYDISGRWPRIRVREGARLRVRKCARDE